LSDGHDARINSVSVQRHVSAWRDDHAMSRRQRQLDELRGLCRAGAVARAVDLAFEHFAQFGRDDEVVDLLADAIGHLGEAERASRRFAELRATGAHGPATEPALTIRSSVEKCT
jgi:hypothetical protein